MRGKKLEMAVNDDVGAENGTKKGCVRLREEFVFTS